MTQKSVGLLEILNSTLLYLLTEKAWKASLFSYIAPGVRKNLFLGGEVGKGQRVESSCWLAAAQLEHREGIRECGHQEEPSQHPWHQNPVLSHNLHKRTSTEGNGSSHGRTEDLLCRLVHRVLICRTRCAQNGVRIWPKLTCLDHIMCSSLLHINWWSQNVSTAH